MIKIVDRLYQTVNLREVLQQKDMKPHTSTLLILLTSVCLAGTSVHAESLADARKRLAVAVEKDRKAAAERMKERIGTIRFQESSSLYNAGNSEYLQKGEPVFDFGPKSGNIKYDKRMIMAAEIAAERAHKHSTSRCWSYVKSALVSANLVSSRPTTEYAKEAGDELQNKYGFRKLAIKDPFAAPLGSVLVYGGRGAGHVEFRTPKGFVSDFTTDRPSRRPLIGVYVKPS
jgi:hypothetical protein